MKLAIIGSRDFTDYKLLCDELKPYLNKITLVISGGAKGADLLGERWARDNNIPIKIFYADWERLGIKAGYIRNHDIIINAECVVSFWDGKSNGTKHSMSLCKEYKKPLKTIIYE